MNVIITGENRGLGKNIKNYLNSNDYNIISIGSLDSYSHHLPTILDTADVFINNEYRDKLQTDLFELVYDTWKYEKKTIINILTSALVFGGPNKKYMDDKKDLENKTFEVRTDDKEVRIINVYPNTLESSVTAPNQKLKFEQVSNIIKYLIELPQDIEIFQIGISKTKLKIETQIL